MRPAALLAVAFILGGCVDLRPCLPDTVLLTFRLSGRSVGADGLQVAVSIDGGPPHSSSVKLQGDGSGTAEIAFPHGFPAGHTITVVVSALLGDHVIASNTGTVTIDGRCGTVSVVIDGGGGEDMSTADLDVPPDLAQCLSSCPTTVACGQIADGCGGSLSCGACQLTALSPSVANAGATVTLEGTFAPDTTVSFPGVAQPRTAQLLGPHRATIAVPPDATAGDLTVVSGRTTLPPQPFRRVSFPLGVGTFRDEYEQADLGRQMPSPSAGGAVVVGKGAVYVLGGSVLDSGGDWISLDGAERAVINADGTLSRFSTLGTKLHRARDGAASVRLGNVIYLIAGRSSAITLDDIETATINPDGTLSAFTIATSALQTARWGHAAVVIGNSLYVIGGYSGTASMSDVERATINPDGTLSPFHTVTDVTLATPVTAHTVSVVGDNVYVIGGLSDADRPGGIQRAKIRGDGTLSTFEKVPTSVLQFPRNTHSAAVVGDNLYVVGGYKTGTGYLDTVERATIDAKGELSNFSVVSKLTRARNAQQSALIGNYLYLIGGGDSRGTGAVPRSERATIDASSAVSAFTAATTQAAVARSLAVTVVSGNNVYVVGGDDGSIAGPPIARATIAADDTLSPFSSTNMPSLKQMRRGAAGLIAGPYLYIVGGQSPANAALGTLERAVIHDDGTISDFEQVAGATLVTARAQHTSVVIGDSVFVLGGFDPAANQPIRSIERAAVDAAGSLSSFTIVSNAALSLARQGHTSVVLGGRLWAMGGLTSIHAGDAERAEVGDDGALGPFQLAAGIGLAAARDLQSAMVVGSSLAIVGGHGWPGPGALGDLLSATIQPDGMLQPFAPISGVALHNQRRGHASIVVGNSIYIIGGENEAGFVGTLEHSTLR
jgi:hypothetical protein